MTIEQGQKCYVKAGRRVKSDILMANNNFESYYFEYHYPATVTTVKQRVFHVSCPELSDKPISFELSSWQDYHSHHNGGHSGMTCVFLDEQPEHYADTAERQRQWEERQRERVILGMERVAGNVEQPVEGITGLRIAFTMAVKQREVEQTRAKIQQCDDYLVTYVDRYREAISDVEFLSELGHRLKNGETVQQIFDWAVRLYYRHNNSRYSHKHMSWLLRLIDGEGILDTYETAREINNV